jgi:hypothetical protein
MVVRLPGDEGVPTNRSGRMERRGKVGRVSANVGVLDLVLE